MNDQLSDVKKTQELSNIEAERLANDLELPGGIEQLNNEAFEQAKRDNPNLEVEY